MWQKINKHRTFIHLLLGAVAVLVLLSPLAHAQAKAPSAILNQYRNQRTTWFTMVWPYANTLFGLLATIEFAWSAAVMLLEKSDMQSWTSALIRKLMWIGAFYALLIYGRTWIPAITDSFELIGQTASGTGPMAPSDVFTRGIDIAGALMATSSTAAFFTNLGTSLAMIFTGIITALAFIAITVQFVVAMVESYIIVAAGFIFLGFGGSRWTAPYVERYIGLGVATGVKIMLLYLLIGTGMNLSVDWMTDAQNIASNASPAMSALEIMGASIIFMMLCWQIPKLFAAVLGGSPALSGGDLVSTRCLRRRRGDRCRLLGIERSWRRRWCARGCCHLERRVGPAPPVLLPLGLVPRQRCWPRRAPRAAGVAQFLLQRLHRRRHLPVLRNRQLPVLHPNLPLR